MRYWTASRRRVVSVTLRAPYLRSSITLICVETMWARYATCMRRGGRESHDALALRCGSRQQKILSKPDRDVPRYRVDPLLPHLCPPPPLGMSMTLCVLSRFLGIGVHEPQKLTLEHASLSRWTKVAPVMPQLG